MYARVTPFSSSERCIAGWQISFLQLLIWSRWVTADTCLSHAEQLTWKLMFHISDHLSLLHCRDAAGVRRGNAYVCVCLYGCVCGLCVCQFVWLYLLFFLFLCSPLEMNTHAALTQVHILLLQLVLYVTQAWFLSRCFHSNKNVFFSYREDLRDLRKKWGGNEMSCKTPNGLLKSKGYRSQSPQEMIWKMEKMSS